MLYITLLDQFHPGIYSSQVIDVCDYLNKEYKSNIRIVAFLSIRELRTTNAKKELKKLSPTALVFPSFPGLKRFELTAIFLFFICLFTGERVAICRNVFCTKMALSVKKFGLLKKVVFDGRSAMSAEIKEYDVFPVDYLRKNVAAFERYVVHAADYRMAVSEKLVEYWREHFSYTGSRHVVIPCTLDRKYFNRTEFEAPPELTILREQMGFKDTDVVLVYAGSTAPWQSFELMEKILKPLMDRDPAIKILFLSKETADNKRLRDLYPGRVVIKWLQHKEVLSHLQCCDYGILFREQSDTNKVASPTKFAEYLYAGLKVLISDHLGDFSGFVKTHSCGYVLDENSSAWPALVKPQPAEKRACFMLAITSFTKEAEKNNASYRAIASV